jgi:hypothetical protein
MIPAILVGTYYAMGVSTYVGMSVHTTFKPRLQLDNYQKEVGGM